MVKLVRFLKPYTASIIACILLVSFQVVCTLQLPKQMSDIINIGIIQKGVDSDMSEPAVAEEIVDAGNKMPNIQKSYLLTKGALMLGIAILAGIAAIAAGYFASRVSASVARDVRGEVFSHVEHFSLLEFDKFSTASLIIRSTNDVVQVQQMTFFLLRLATMAPLTAIGAIYMAIQTDSSMAWILAVTIPLLIALIVFLMYYALPLFRSIQAKTDNLNLIAREGLTGVRVIRAFGRESTQDKRFAQANDELTDINIKVNRVMVLMMPAMQILIQFTSVAIIWFGSKYISQGTMQLGDMMAFLQYANQILFSVMMLSMIFIMYPRASVSAERINDVLDTTTSINDPVQALKGDGSRPSVEFRDVSFSFEGSEEPAVSGINFKTNAGSTTAIIGSTGSGKSTILNLIERLYDASAGEVLVNGVNVKDQRQHHLHDLIAYVPQKAVLFTGTVADNIRFGKDGASKKEINEALDIAQATEFVAGLGDGLESIVSQGGSNFSGGQKQRLAIARAIVKRPGIYLFDDSFSALDLKTDAKLRKALKPWLANSAAIIVAQRISTIIDAEQILVFDEGKIVGKGTHEQLLESCTVYQEIAASQLSEEELTHE